MKKTLITVCALMLGSAFAHQTQTVAGGQYRIVFGLLSEPAFTDQRNGLDLIVQTGQGQPVANLEKSLKVTLISPDGRASRDMTLRAQYNKPGAYTDDIVLTVPGEYTVRVSGFIGDQQINTEFKTHEVKALNTLFFPAQP
ncbi:hypothetical protein HNR42_000270 [Deinobacterium chartae]|uniref:YtkA-like n=1 Tax=Deinobacterium chartae TaxID=521158 RepID=A0A841HY50_9DEIO|nr:hypothetical protein [Deinobacterium chartae]MBB6096858.1 hypothetical protein [Deinobacterium chartae]